MGVAAGNIFDKKVVFIAKSIACAFLESNKRPIWGIMVWNNAFLKYDQQGFQEVVYVGVKYIFNTDSLNDSHLRFLGHDV